MRCTAVALFALTACVVENDDPDELPLTPSAIEADAPAVDELADRVPATPPTATNRRPQPAIDVIATVEDNEVKIAIADILANDVDPDGGRIVLAGLGAHRGGTVVQIGAQLVFTPEPDFAGAGWFDYIVSDGRLRATGRVKVDIAAVNDAPVAYGDQISVVASTDTTFELTTFDPDGDTLAVEILEAPSHGALNACDDKYVYQPDPSFTGVDRLVYRVGDGAAWSEPVAIDLMVAPR